MKLSALFTIALASSLSLGTVAYADDASDEARSLLGELEFEKAQELARSALEEGSRGPEDTAGLYLILGEIAASLGEESKAQELFEKGLSIDMKAALPEGLSPKITAPYDAAKSALGDHGGIRFDAKWQDAKSIVANADTDPKELISSYRIVLSSAGDGGEPSELSARGRTRAVQEIPAGSKGISIVALDEHGNRLSAAQSVDDLSPFAKAEKKTASSGGGGRGPAIYERWQLYGALALVSAGAGGFLGSRANSIASDIEALPDGTEFSVAQAMEDDAKQKALFANISFGVAGAFAAGALWLYLRDDDGDESPKPKTAILPVLSPDEVGVRASLSF